MATAVRRWSSKREVAARGRVRIKGDVSSQFLSGLLMAAAYAARQMSTSSVEGPLVSGPYVEMTDSDDAAMGLAICRVEQTRLPVSQDASTR